MLYEFPEYLPDLPAYKNPGMVEAENVIPAGNSYQQAKGLVNIYNALDAYARGAKTTTDKTGANVSFVGNGTKIYRLISNTWTDVTRNADPYATASEQIWDFTQFGTHVIATNFTDEVQTVDLSAAATTKFTDLAGTPPQCKYLTTIKDFVLTGNVLNAPYRVRWSGIGDQTSWATSSVTQAGQQDLDSQYGPITSVIGGEYAVVFQERAITRLEYVGSPIVFAFSTQETNQGTRYPKSVIKVGDGIFYIGTDGFYVFDGHRSHSIGVNKVDKTFLAMVSVDSRDRVSVSLDHTRHLICWAVPTSSSVSGAPSHLFYYNYAKNSKNRWSIVQEETDLLFTARSPGYTMDNIGSIETGQTLGASSITGSMELLPASLDSQYYMGGTFQFGAFAPQRVTDGSSTSSSVCNLNLFTGPALGAKLQTAEIQLTPGQRTELQLIKPLVTGDLDSGSSISATAMAVTMKIGERNLLSENVTYQGPYDMNGIGQVPVRSNARYHRLQVEISHGFGDAIGVEVLESKPGGYR